ncbi:MAG: DUF1670 domain-containing protein [Lentisphaeria bacterium]|nr:DUF1670 domain-containing protein [Lentisphaeria bacterium]
MWTTVHKNARGSYGKSIKDTELTPVVLTLIQSEDAMDRARGKKLSETCHSARAIERYITSFKQILLCYRKGMNIDEIAFSVRKTKNLVQEYLDIIEIYRDRMYILKRLENYEVCVETVIERNKHSMTR